jgi:isochorismate hydrolase
MSKTRKKYWTPERIARFKELVLNEPNYRKVCKEFKIDNSYAQSMASRLKAERPLISANWGGKRT